MHKPHVHIAKAFTIPRRVCDVADEMDVPTDTIYRVFGSVRKQGIKIESIGHTPHMYFYIKPQDLRNVALSLTDEIVDILKAGDVWTFKELAEVLNKDEHCIRRCVNDIERRGKLKLNKQRFFSGRAWKMRFQWEEAEHLILKDKETYHD